MLARDRASKAFTREGSEPAERSAFYRSTRRAQPQAAMLPDADDLYGPVDGCELAVVGESVVTEDEDGGGMLEAAPAAAPAGPQLTVTDGRGEAAARVQCTAPTGQTTETTLVLNNTGSTALRVSWERAARPTQLDTSADGLPRFFFDQSTCVLVPGQQRAVVVTFRSAQAGIFTDHWTLRTAPRMASRASVALSFCGIATNRDTTASARRDLETRLERAALERSMRALVLSLADNAVLVAASKAFRPPQPITDADRFLLLNNSVSAHYCQRTVNALADLHARVYRKLHAPAAAAASVPPSAKGAKKPAGKKGAAAEEPRPEDLVPVPDWDLSIHALV